MGFDGSARDRLTSEASPRLLRPATLAQALARYPLFVLLLKRDELDLSFASVAEGPAVVSASRRGSPGRWTMLRSDFDLCKEVARRVDVSVFPTDPESAILGRVEAQIRVLFS